MTEDEKKKYVRNANIRFIILVIFLIIIVWVFKSRASTIWDKGYDEGFNAGYEAGYDEAKDDFYAGEWK